MDWTPEKQNNLCLIPSMDLLDRQNQVTTMVKKKMCYIYEVWNTVYIDSMRMTFKDVGMQPKECSECNNTSKGDPRESTKKKTSYEDG